jgi:hypothetical protein
MRYILIMLVLTLSGCNCIESRDGYCPPDKSIVISESINNAKGAGL